MGVQYDIWILEGVNGFRVYQLLNTLMQLSNLIVISYRKKETYQSIII